MAQVINGKVVYPGGEALPTVGTEAYNQAQAGIIPTAPIQPVQTPQTPILPKGISVNIPQTITSADLAPSSKSLSLPSPYVPTASAGLMGAIDSVNLQAMNNIAPLVDQEKIDTASENKKGLFDRLSSFITGRQGETSLTDQAYSQDNGLGTVDTTKQELTDITNQINTKQLAYRREAEALVQQGGRTTQGTRDALNALDRRASSELADLSIIQSAKSNNYANAKEIADRKVAVQLEKDKNEYEALKFFYDENKEEFNKQEDRKYQLLLNERKRLLDQQESEKKAVNDIAIEYLKNGGSQAIAQKILNSPDQKSALALTGNMIGLIDRQIKYAQLANINSEIDARRVQNANGGVIPGQIPTGKADFVSAGFANRSASANSIIDKIGNQFAASSASNIIGTAQPLNILKSSQRQQFEQAQRNFINAVLRKESGATIQKEEFDNAKLQYFPQVGDSPAVLQQKAANRIDAINSLIGSAGTAYKGTFMDYPKTQVELTPIAKGTSGTLSSGITWTVE